MLLLFFFRYAENFKIMRELCVWKMWFITTVQFVSSSNISAEATCLMVFWREIGFQKNNRVCLPNKFYKPLNIVTDWKLSIGFVLAFTIPYHTIPYHTIPYHTIPYHTIPYHTIPYHTIPYHTIPYHTIPYHTIPYHTIPYHTIPYQTRPDQTRPDQTRPDQTRPDQTRPDQTRPDQTRPDQTRPDQTRPDQTRPDQTRPDQTRPDQTRPYHTIPYHTIPYHTIPYHTIPCKTSDSILLHFYVHFILLDSYLQDLKPENVLVCHPCQKHEVAHLKLTDFGIACEILGNI